MEEKRKPRSFSGKRETGYEKRETGRGKPKMESGRPKSEGRMEKGEWRKGKGESEKSRTTRRGDFHSRPSAGAESEERRGRSFAGKRTGTEERRGRSFTDQKPETGERRGRKFSDQKPEFGERRGRSFSDQKPKFGERKGRSFADQKPGAEERRGRKFSDQKTEGYNRTEDRPPRKRRDVTAESEILSEIVELRRREGRSSPKKQKILSLEYEEKHGPIRLNKYISNSGICSRRDADMLIQTGAILVNGQIVTELGAKVMPTDEVRFGDRILQREKPVYLLLNKPKDYITTMEDERDRKHVTQLIKGACKERVYPVGRLDKNTTGLLLFTNDGEMTKKLTHPKHGIRKIYYVELNKNLTAADFEKIANGIELSDGEIIVDEIAYAGETKREIGITLHSGRNRIVRRIFEQLGYEVEKLDRVVFAGLTKKDLPRGKYRFLTDAEINILKMIK
jgi:23S rRNA pseudouridine2605 synthase